MPQKARQIFQRPDRLHETRWMPLKTRKTLWDTKQRRQKTRFKRQDETDETGHLIDSIRDEN